MIGIVDAGRVYSDERRTLLPPIRFGLAVARHFWRHGSDYDVVHIASFPYFPLLAASALRRRGGYRLVVNWIEVWSKAYWRRYGGRAIGTVGWAVQRACIRIPHDAYCISTMHADRLVSEGYRGTPVVLPGLYAGPIEPTPATDVDPRLVVYAGRHVREKRVDLLVRAFLLAREHLPDLRLELYGDGPESGRIERIAAAGGADGWSAWPASARSPRSTRSLGPPASRPPPSARATARRRGGGRARHAECDRRRSGERGGRLVDDGVNGVVAPDATVESLATAIVTAVEAGASLRDSTARWFEANASRLRIEASLQVVADAYRGAVRSARSPRR